jgi:hypothetical protein
LDSALDKYDGLVFFFVVVIVRQIDGGFSDRFISLAIILWLNLFEKEWILA